MEDEIKVGEYVRTNKGVITKAHEKFIERLINGKSAFGKAIKHSKNIIDLIEEGDYVNGEKITDIYYGNRISSNKSNFNEDDIKTIVTKKQFASMEYKVKE